MTGNLQATLWVLMSAVAVVAHRVRQRHESADRRASGRGARDRAPRHSRPAAGARALLLRRRCERLPVSARWLRGGFVALRQPRAGSAT